jgi:hypothetical protein
MMVSVDKLPPALTGRLTSDAGEGLVRKKIERLFAILTQFLEYLATLQYVTQGVDLINIVVNDRN